MMNVSTIIAILIIVVLMIVAIRYLYKHGTCGGCPDAPNCSGHCHKDLINRLKIDPKYEEKSAMIDEIMKKHEK